MKILSIIPARGGSKGLLKKNIYPLNGKPLIAYTIEASIKSGVITKTIVSSENDEILNIAKQFGAEILVRPDEISSDLASSESVIEHVIKTLQNKNENYDILVLLQPTSPLRNSEDIKQAIELFLNYEALSLISVYEPLHTPYKSFKLNENGFLCGLLDNKTPFLRRQDLPKTFMPNGAIYITYCDLFLETQSLFSDKTIPFVMNENNSIDVDTKEDIERIEKRLSILNL
jgi:CMP-N,N'-diacetyllegionaminic acid synthase